MVMVTVGVIVVFGALSIQGNPAMQTKALIAYLKQPFYTMAFAASHGISMASALTGFTNAEPSIRNQDVNAESIPVLIYHGVLSKSDGSPINITEARFKDHMFALKRAGYETITLDELYRFAKGELVVPQKSIVITFDDGRSDSYYGSDPILASVDYSAAMFVITRYADEAKTGGYYLSAEEVAMLEESGRWEVGAHSKEGHVDYPIDKEGTMGHFFSNRLWKEDEQRIETEKEFETRITHDFAISQSYLEELLGKPIKTFAFPFGDFGQNQKDGYEKAKLITSSASRFYDILFYQYRPGDYYTHVYPAPEDDKRTTLIRRVDVRGTWTGEELVERLSRGMAKSLPHYDNFESNKGWIGAWGTYRINNDTLSMRASDSQTGAAIILDGSASWRDYEVTAQVESPQRTGVLVWTRFLNDDNNASCNFGKDFVHVEQILDGEKRVLKGIRGSGYIPEGPFTVSARVEGRSVACSINGKVLVETEFLDPSLTRGGIGFKIWDAALGKSSIILHNLTVEEIEENENIVKE